MNNRTRELLLNLVDFERDGRSLLNTVAYNSTDPQMIKRSITAAHRLSALAKEAHELLQTDRPPEDLGPNF
jgi:hypothetical protein